MRYIKTLFLTIASLFVLSTTASGQDYRKVLERPWNGFSKLKVNFTKSGEAVIRQKYTMKFDIYYNMTGSGTATITLDGKDYVYSCAISGKFNTGNYTLTYKTGTVYRADKLPQELDWCAAEGELELKSDAKDAGHFSCFVRWDTQAVRYLNQTCLQYRPAPLFLLSSDDG